MKATLNGPIWFAALLIMLTAVGLSLFVAIDSLRPRRRAATAWLPEPLWVYTGLAIFFLISVVLPQLIPGLSIVSALPVLGAPVAIISGITYLLRVVFPRRPISDAAEDEDAEAREAESLD